MDPLNPGMTPATTTQGSAEGSPTATPEGVAPVTPQNPEGSQVAQDPLQPVAPVVPSGQPATPAAPVAPVVEPQVDPLADALKTNAGKQNINLGQIDFDKAADKHFEEFSTALAGGDTQIIENLGKLKPKMLEQVVSRLGKKFTIGDRGVEFSNLEELSAALGHNVSAHTESGSDEVAVTNLKLGINNKFLEALQTKGITLADFKKTPQYLEVAQKAADQIAWMRQAGVPFSQFDKAFPFDVHFENAMRGVDAQKAVAEAKAAAQKIASAREGAPITTPAPMASSQMQNGKNFPAMVNQNDFFSRMTPAGRKAYAAEWTDKSGTIQFAK